MNGEIPSVPITTLAGISSLTDLLPELPLPSPLPHTINNKSLLFDKKIAEQAKAVLATKNEAVISQLVNALRQTNTDNIELKDNLAGDAIEGDIPQLLRGILAQDPGVFKAGSSYNAVNSTGHGTNNQNHGNGNGNDSLSRHNSFSAGFGGASTSRFQEQFANFTQQQIPGTNATVNGGSPSVYGHGFKPPQSSPAQATAALLSGDLPHEEQASFTEDRNKRKQLKSAEPVVVLKPLSEEAIGEATKRSSSSSAPPTPPMPTSEKVPVVSLRRVDDSTIAKDKKKNRALYTVTSPSSGLGITLKISKAKSQEDQKSGGKRKRSTDEGDPPVDDFGNGDILGPGERPKRLRRKTTLYQATPAGDAESIDGDDDVVDLDSPPDSPFEPPKELKAKESKKDPFRSRLKDDDTKPEKTGIAMNFADMHKKRMKDLKNRAQLPQAMQSVEELMESPTFKRFSNAIDTILELAEDVDIAELDKDDDDDDDVGSSESLVSRSLLSELSNEAAKLKSMGVTNQVPTEKLIKVLTILQCNIKDGCRVIRHAKVDDDDDDEDDDRSSKIDKATAATDAALTALYIMTSPNMPKEVFLEDVIDKTIRLARNQTLNRIYPEFDPVYRIDPRNTTGYSGNNKMKRARATGAKNKSIINLYNKITDLLGTLSELVDIQELTDTLILQTSTIAVSPFFVENISELQLNSLKLVTSIFSRYEKHRQLILEDILSSLARLPSSKKNLRNYRLNSDEHIQMVTALALELIQCVVQLPSIEKDDRPPSPGQEESAKKKKDQKMTKKQLAEEKAIKLVEEVAKQEKLKVKLIDREVTITTMFETAAITAHNFLTVFLKKCTHKGEEDYRPLFENFVYDLLATVNKPEWPAAELLLNLLGRLLVKQFSNKSVEMSLRVASLDYLGIVAARLRKDTVSSKLNEELIEEIIEQINEDEVEVKPTRSRKSQQAEERDKTQELQKALLDYLIYNAQNDPALVFARQFYIAMWYWDSAGEIERSQSKNQKTPEKDKKPEKKKEKPTRRSSRRVVSESESEEEPDEISEEEDEEETKKKKDIAAEFERAKMVQMLAEKRKAFLLKQITAKVGAFATFKPSPSKLDYENGCLVTRYLASNRPLSQCFDIYLSQILKVLCETAVAVRTKAMKCLTAVVEADPSLLARPDMQGAVHARLLDQSTSVREAAIELVGKFILIRPELTDQYFNMLSDRILDTGISVRKRVIKIFRDVCLEQTEFSKIPEMCVKMIRRVNDEEGIKKLVNETFQSMWFSPVSDRDGKKLLTRVMNITDVVAACKETGHDWFEQLLENLLHKEESSSLKPVEKACTQIIMCLVENVLRLEEKSSEGGSHAISPRLLACFSTLFLFCKVRPELMVPHSYTIQPYLDIKCNSPSDHLIPHSVARILEQAIPLMEHPSESFLATLEEDMMRLILRHGMTVLQSCVSCLGAVVNNVSHNYTLVRDCFQKFFGVLSRVMEEHKRDPTSPQLVSSRPTLLRSLFTVGLLCKHFDFDSQEFGEKRVSVKDKVFEVLLYFISHEDEEVQLKALAGLGFFCVRHFEYMLGVETKELYHHLLTDSGASSRMCCQVLKNIQNYLLEEEEKMIKADHEWRKNATKEDLKEMGDLQSGMASTIIQLYLKHVLESFFHSQSQVRLHALSVATLILRQGLVHPVQCVPYLICMGADLDSAIRVKADQQLQEIDKKYPGFIQMKAIHGVKMSYKMQELLQNDPLEPVRGIREEENNVIAANSYIYSLIRSNRGQRRALLSSMLNSFDDTARTSMKELLYLADNLAHFPYQHQDEPLFIIHQIDIIVSVSGSNLIQSFREVFYPEAAEKSKFDEDEDDDLDILIGRLPEDMTPLQEYFLASQGCVLLLVLKQHLKEQYGFTDNKIQRYSPTDSAKMYDKPLNRKHGIKFNPKQALDLLRAGPLPTEVDDEGKVALVQSYIDFKQLMLSIDPDDDDEDDVASKAVAAGQKAGTPAGEQAQPAADTANADSVLNKSTESNEDGDKPPAMDTQDKDDDDDDDGDITIVEVTPGRRSRHHHQSPPSQRVNHTLTKSSSAYRLSIGNLLEKKRGRQSNAQSTPSSHKSRNSTANTPKHKPKKKRRRRRMSDSDEDSDDDSDPDFAL